MSSMTTMYQCIKDVNFTETPKESESSSSSGSLEAVTIIYTETKVPTSEWSSTFTSYSSETSTSVESSESLPVFDELAIMKDMEASFGYVPVKVVMSTSKGPKMQAFDYFWTHHMFALFSYLMSHLLAHSPEEPIKFLVSLVDRCLKYCDQDEDPPLLFEDSHVRSVYTALDPMDDGTIEYKQYVNGMMTLGLSEFNLTPEGLVGKNRNVPKDVFIREAKLALLNQLDVLIGKNKREGSLSHSNKNSNERSRIYFGGYSASDCTKEGVIDISNIASLCGDSKKSSIYEPPESGNVSASSELL